MSDLKVDLRYFPVSKPTKRPDGTIEPPAQSSNMSSQTHVYRALLIFIVRIRLCCVTLNSARVPRPCWTCEDQPLRARYSKWPRKNQDIYCMAYA